MSRFADGTMRESASGLPNASLRALLAGALDYAGLFPPAGLSMNESVRSYAAYASGPHSWLLGRFVVAGARLAEFAGAADASMPVASRPWRVSVLLSADAEAEIATVAAFNASHRGAVCDTVECKASTVDDIARVARVAPAIAAGEVASYVEIPAAGDPAGLLAALAARGLRAKIRTGGTTPDAFPSAAEVSRFLAACIRARLPFKATAGLHHALRGEYRLTYEPGSPAGPMYGFLNLLLATALLRDGGSEQDAEALLLERDAAALQFGDDGARWRDRLFLTARLSQLRQRAAVSFGSCSFAEPVDELSALGLL